MSPEVQESEQYKILKMKSFQEILEYFLKSISIYTEEEQKEIKKALEVAQKYHEGQLRASQAPYIIHPLAVSSLLVGMKMDSSTVIAGLLHDTLEDTSLTKEELKNLFGKEVLILVDGVTKILAIDEKNPIYKEANTIRKMLLAMCDDIRVIFIKLADKLHNMSTLEYLPLEKQEKNAKECLDIYAPLASKLGIGSIHNVLEDLAFKILHPDKYQEIKSFVQSNKKDRETYLTNICNQVLKKCNFNEKIQIQARSKHFYSIYQKFKRRSKEFTEIFDMLGLRICCETKAGCYSILGLIHSLYKPVEGRFKDYIAAPKANGYQSIHTNVFMDNKKFVEFQIRTYQMHHIAEYGIASHWLYKEDSAVNKQQEIELVNRLKQWHESLPEEGYEFLSSIKKDILQTSIYVFTPLGEVIELPEGSNAIDFAYSIHTDIGNHCYQAKVEGKIYPITKPLKMSSVVEIITNSKSHPIPNWLSTVRTRNSRSRIRAWLNKNSPQFILQEALLLKKPRKDLLTESLPNTHSNDTRLQKNSVISDLLRFFKRKKNSSTPPEEKIISESAEMNKMLIHMAACCNPLEGDDIVGYVSRGKGISIHKVTCKNLSHLPERSQRLIEVNWIGQTGDSLHRFDITFLETQNIFGLLENIFKNNKANLVSGKIDRDGSGQGLATFHIECSRIKSQLLLEKIEKLPWVKTVSVRGQEWTSFL